MCKFIYIYYKRSIFEYFVFSHTWWELAASFSWLGLVQVYEHETPHKYTVPEPGDILVKVSSMIFQV